MEPATVGRAALCELEASAGSKVMQFLVEGRYVAVVADGDVKLYVGRSSKF